MSPLVPRLRRHPWLTGATAAVVAAAVAVGVYFGTRSEPAAAQTATTTQTVSTGTIRQSVSASGTLAPAQEENLNFSVSGTVTSVKVSAGQSVKKGQVLATVESASLAAAVAQAKASVASAQAKVDSDESNGASDTQTAADEAALTAAQNQLSSANSQLSAARLTSPIDGVVADLNLTVGQAVSGSGSSNGGNNGSSGGSSGGNSPAGGSSSSSSSAQVLVISQQSWIVNATVDATSVGLIKVGNQAQLTVDGVTDTVYGTIAQIGLVSSSSSGTASYPVVIDVTGNPAGLHDGASVTATLIYKQLANVLVIPATALHRDTSGTYVEKVQNGKTVKATVTTGISSGAQVQIVSGLGAGDTIVVPQAGFGRTANSNGNTNRTGRTGGTGNFPAGGGNFPAGGGNFPAGGFPGGGSRGGN